MTIPQLPQKYEEPGLLTPAKMSAYRRQKGRYPRQSPPYTIIFCYQKRLFSYAAKTYRGKAVSGFMGDVQLLRKTDKRIGVVGHFGMGASITAVLLEDLAEWGVCQFVIVGLAGGIQPDQNSGDWVLVHRAVRDEGTSHHYLPAAAVAAPATTLMHRLEQGMAARERPFTTGPTWTTDAPYRETPAEIRHYQKAGVLTVEMEAATLFIVGQFCGVETAVALVVSDRLTPDAWLQPPDPTAVHHSLTQLFDTAVVTLQTL